jgi:hypothetical protein
MVSVLTLHQRWFFEQFVTAPNCFQIWSGSKYPIRLSQCHGASARAVALVATNLLFVAPWFCHVNPALRSEQDLRLDVEARYRQLLLSRYVRHRDLCPPLTPSLVLKDNFKQTKAENIFQR